MHNKTRKMECLYLLHNKFHNFIAFVVSTDGMLGYEATILVRSLAFKFSRMGKYPYLHMCGNPKAWMSIDIVWVTYRCICGSRVRWIKMNF